jgi:hypothetical protein
MYKLNNLRTIFAEYRYNYDKNTYKFVNHIIIINGNIYKLLEV